MTLLEVAATIESNSSNNSNNNNSSNHDLEYNISQIAQGNKEAVAAIYEATKSAVYGFALSFLKNSHDAEDILQETYLKIWSSAALYSSQDKPMAWILTIVRNLSLSKLRSGQRISDINEQKLDSSVMFPANTSIEDKMILDAALNKLSDDESRIVMLHAVTGFKHREIAGLLQIPLPTVLSKYRRALKKLKDILEDGEKK